MPSITKTPRLDLLSYSAGIKKPSREELKKIQQPLISSREKAVKELAKMGIPDTVENFQKDVLDKLIQHQISQGLPRDQHGNEYVILFASDRDNSTTYGHDYLTPALKEGGSFKSLAETHQKSDPDKLTKLLKYLAVTQNMNRAQQSMISAGIPVLAASGAVPPEAVQRIHNGEPAPLAAAWSTGTEHHIQSNPKETDPKEIHYSIDPQYTKLLNSVVNYNKDFILRTMKTFIEDNKKAKDFGLRFQPGMDDSNTYKFITSFHLNTTMSNLKNVVSDIDQLLNLNGKKKDYDIKSGVDAEGSSKDASEGKITQLYINIEPTMKKGKKPFDGKDLYFQHITQMSQDIVNEHSPKPSILTFGIADSNNDLLSITSEQTKGLAIIPSNAVKIKENGSSLQSRLSNLDNVITNKLAQELRSNGMTYDNAKVLANNVKIVTSNPQRFIYFPQGPNSEINLGVNDGYKILHALIKIGAFAD